MLPFDKFFCGQHLASTMYLLVPNVFGPKGLNASKQFIKL